MDRLLPPNLTIESKHDLAVQIRKQLIAEARGILSIMEKYGGDVSEGEWARISNGPFNRLREILDELERLP